MHLTTTPLRIAFLLLLAGLFAACGSDASHYEAGESATQAYEEAPPPAAEKALSDQTVSFAANTEAPAPPTAQAQQRKVIYTGSLSLQTDELDTAVAKTKRLVAQVGGYISEEALDNGYNRQTQRLVLRIPAAKYEDVVAKLEAMADYVEDKQLTANDITEEFVDNELRLKSLRATEEQYLQVLRQARTVSEILEVRQYLGQVRSDIERIEGRQRYLNDQVSMSTLTVSFYLVRELPTAPGETFWDKVGKALGTGWDGILAFLLIVVTAWPILLVVGTILVVLRLRQKRRRAKEEAENAQP